MKMQDDEFDDLFRSKLNNFEQEPSANVWKKVNHALNTNDRRKVFSVLGIAASFLLVAASGVFYLTHKTPVSNIRTTAATVAKITPGSNERSPVTSHQAEVKIAAAAYTPKTDKYSAGHDNASKRDNTSPQEIAAVSTDTGKNLGEKVATLKTDLPQIAHGTITARVPDENTPIVIKDLEETTASIKKPAPVVIELPGLTNRENAPDKPKHKVRKLGDLINVVVAAVDKRKDKLIEFTNDDDESTITGVNLGIIKLKKDQ